MYDDETPRRRRSIVPILAVIAAILAIAVGVAVVLFALGYFDHPPGSGTTAKVARRRHDAAGLDQRGAVARRDDAGRRADRRAEGGRLGGSADAGRAAGALDPRRLAGALRHARRGAGRAMRAHAIRHRRGPRQRRADGDHPEDRRQEGADHAHSGAARRAPALRARAQDRRRRHGARRVRALPAERLRRRGDPRGQAADGAEGGQTATFIIFQTPEEGIGIPISLNGFGPGYDALPYRPERRRRWRPPVHSRNGHSAARARCSQLWRCCSSCRRDRFAYWQAWVYLLVFGAATTAITLYVLDHDPALMERRLRAGPAAETERGQQIVQSIASVGFIAIFIIAGLGQRFGWSSVPAGCLWLATRWWWVGSGSCT